MTAVMYGVICTNHCTDLLDYCDPDRPLLCVCGWYVIVTLVVEYESIWKWTVVQIK